MDAGGRAAGVVAGDGGLGKAMPTIDEIIAQLSFLVATPAVLGVGITAAVMVLLRDWRASVAALAVQAVLTALLYTLLLPAQLIGAKLLVGLFVALLYFVTGAQLSVFAEDQPPSGEGPWWRRLQLRSQALFRLFAVLMVAVASTQVSVQLQGVFQVPALVADAGVLLVGLGLLNLGLSNSPFLTGLGLTTLLMGFGLFYSAVEPALAVMAMLAGVDFAVALAASYLSLSEAAKLLSAAEAAQARPRDVVVGTEEPSA